jgi:enterochelin esterase-like enzyme
MSQRIPTGAGSLLLLLALGILLTSGLAPAASAHRQEATSQQQANMPDSLAQGSGFDGAAATLALPTVTIVPAPTVTPVPPTPIPTPVYVPLSEPPAPLVAADLCAETRGQVSVHQFYSESLHRNMRYRIYLPPCYTEAGRLFPVLYMFHGLNYGDSQWDVLGLDELVDAGIAAGEMPPLIIVMPNIWGIDRNPDGGPGSVEEALVQDLLPHVETQYCAWNTRQGRAIGGLSRGAFWALEIAFRYPSLFASVGGHSPAVFWDNALPQYNPYYLVDDAPDLESLRIYLDLGEQDWLNKWVPGFLERLDERGLAYTFTTAPGDHGDAYWRSQVPAYLDFYTAVWPIDWRELPTPPDCTAHPTAPGCRNGLGLGRPCDIALP